MNPIFKGIAPSVIRAINDRKRPGAIDLGMGQPLLKPDMAPLRQALDWVAQNGCPYMPNAGDPALRQAIARHYRYPGLDTPESVVITIGSQEALYLAVKALLDPGRDEVLIIGPAFPAYAKICEMEGVAVREVMLDPQAGFAADAGRVLAAVGPRTRLVILATPNNPTGRIWPEEELIRLGQGLLERSSERTIYLLVDEVYRDLYYTPAPTPAAARFYPHTLVAGSLSKNCALTGLRLGWLMMPAETQAAIYKAHQLVVSCVDTIAQRAALAIFEQPERLGAHRPHYVAQQQALCQILDELGLAYLRPEGAFYCLLQLPASSPWAGRSMDFAMTLLERENVVVIPGSAFEIEGWLRISYVAPPAELAVGLGKVSGLLSSRM